MKHEKVISELAKLRNGNEQNEVIAKYFKYAKQNIIWFFSLSKDPVGHKELKNILDFKYYTIKNALRKIMKSEFALQYIKKELINNQNIYTNTIPVDMDIEWFVKEVNKTIDMDLVESKIGFAKRIQNLNITLPYEHGFPCVIHYLQRAGERGLSFDELVESFGWNDELENIDPGLKKHGLGFLKNEFGRWKASALRIMHSTRIVNNKKYYFLTQGFDLDMVIFRQIPKGTFKLEEDMKGKTVRSTTQVWDKKSALTIINNDKQKTKTA